jgi:hypothetical protein
MRSYFVSNPSPVCLARTSFCKPLDVDDENHENINLPPNLSHQNSNQQQQQNQQQIPPWWFSSQAPPFLTKQTQHIVVESCANKAREEEAKPNTNMLSLFLIGTKMGWDDGTIVSTLLPTNIMENKNILAQP